VLEGKRAGAGDWGKTVRLRVCVYVLWRESSEQEQCLERAECSGGRSIAASMSETTGAGAGASAGAGAGAGGAEVGTRWNAFWNRGAVDEGEERLQR
jgi:hypothetical protein